MHWAITPMSLYVHKQNTYMSTNIYIFTYRQNLIKSLQSKMYYNSQLAEQSTEIKEFK